MRDGGVFTDRKAELLIGQFGFDVNFVVRAKGPGR